MNRSESVKFFAQLVHSGLLDAALAKAALEARDPGRYLIESGLVTPAQWREWVDTNAGTRPNLTRYGVGELLGQGGEARVFEAVDKQSGERVALKVLRSELSKDPAVVRRFVAEAKLLGDLDCPNIVSGLRVAREGTTYFSAMEIIEGVNLQDRLATDGPLDEDTALEVVRQIAGALEYLHRRQLVHRDIKPGNVMWTDDRRAVLIDLGFAISGPEAGDSDRTAGTVHYISPEQARGHGDLDVRADIYSLGATLYHLLVGSLPFSGESSEEVMAKQVLEALSGDEIRAVDLSPQAHYLIEKMMAKEKEIRFQSPGELAREVDAVLQQRAAEAERTRPASRPGTGSKASKPRTSRLDRNRRRRR